MNFEKLLKTINYRLGIPDAISPRATIKNEKIFIFQDADQTSLTKVKK